MKYAIEIERQNAALEIHMTPAKLRIQSQRPSFTVNSTPAKLSIERQAPQFRRPEPGEAAPPQQRVQAGPDDPQDVLQLSKRFEGYNNGTEVVSSLASKHAANINAAANSGAAGAAQAQNQGALGAVRHQQRVAVAENEAAREEEPKEWDPGYVKMSWEAHSIELKWDVHPLEVEYEPYSVEISMKNYPSVRIRAHAVHSLGRRVDRRV